MSLGLCRPRPSLGLLASMYFWKWRALGRCAEFGAAFCAAGELAGSTCLLLARTSALLPLVVSTCVAVVRP